MVDTGAESGDILLFGAADWLTASNFMGQLLVKIGHDRGLAARMDRQMELQLGTLQETGSGM